MSIDDDVVDLLSQAVDLAKQADAVYDEHPDLGRQLFEKAERYKAQADALKTRTPEAVAQHERWNTPPPEPKSDEPNTKASIWRSASVPGFTVIRSNVGVEASRRAKQQLFAAVGVSRTPETPPAERRERPRERRAVRRVRTRGPDDSDPSPSDTPLQRAQAAAWLLDRGTFREFAAEVLIRLQQFEGGESR